MRDWEEAAGKSSRAAAVATTTVEHEGRRIKVDVVMAPGKDPAVYYADVALRVPRLRIDGRMLDSGALSWRPY